MMNLLLLSFFRGEFDIKGRIITQMTTCIKDALFFFI